MHEFIRLASQYAAYFMEGVAVFVIVVGAVRALVLHATHCMVFKTCVGEFVHTRLRLGHALSLGLEFLIGADILKSAVSPTWKDLGLLASIVAIRAVVNFLLMWELKEAEQKTALLKGI